MSKIWTIDSNSQLEGWKLKKLGEIIDLKYGESLPENYREKGEIPVYGSNGVVGFHKRALVKGPGIIVGRKGTVGAVNWSNEDFFPIDTTYYVTLSNPKINLEWVYYLLSSIRLDRLNAATGVPGLNRGDALSLLVLVSPIKEQQEIASILRSIDNTINKTRELIEKYKMTKQGLMKDLLTRGVDEDGKIREKGDFELAKIRSFALVTDIDHKMPPSVCHGIPFISSKDITEDGEIIFDGVKQISEESFNRLSRKICPKNGDIILSRIGTIGRVGLVRSNQKFLMSYSCCVIRTMNSKVDPVYLSYALKSEMINKQILLETQSIGVPDLGLEKISEFEIKIPREKKEQERIAEVLLLVDKKIRYEQAYLNKLTKIKTGLMQDLLTGKVRVKVEECQENSHM